MLASLVSSRALLMTPATPSCRPHLRHAAARGGTGWMGEVEEKQDEEQRRRGLFWRRARDKVAELESDASLSEGIDAVAGEAEAVIAARRRMLDTKLKRSLKRFRSEVTEEVETQATEASQRQERLKERQALIFESLAGLREDILDEIEARTEGVRRGGRTLESSLRELRTDWEKEVNLLIEEAQQDVRLVVGDVEDVIKEQREDWQRSVELFEAQWQLGVGVGGLGGPNATGADGKPRFFARPKEVGARLPEIQSVIANVSSEIEDELSLAKQRWWDTKQKLETMPKQLGVASWEELPKKRSLSEVRAYVADSVFAGSTAGAISLVGSGGGRATRDRPATRPDPLGLRRSDDPADAVLVPTAASNLRTPGRYLNVVTTAALPWMTGTSINPLLRAAHLARAGYDVALYVPWLASPADQERLFPAGLRFERPAQQEVYMRWWLENRANVADVEGLKIRWFAAEYKEFIGCVLQRDGDIIEQIPEAERDVVILEEPEHINWYHHGPRWTDAFNHVVGVAHTNYLQYCLLNAAGWSSAELKATFTELMNNVVVAAHTDVVVRLSATLPPVPGYDLVCNVHGVRAEFLAVGAAAAQKPSAEDAFPHGAYFLGKALWTKGYRELFDIFEEHKAQAHAAIAIGGIGAATDDGEGEEGEGEEGEALLPPVDTYGSGKEQAEIRELVATRALPVRVNDGIDHAHPSLHGYRVFVNPSTSDVLCTATAEALAMGKKVLIPDHPSNTFFRQFSNAILYESEREMVPLLREALRTPPTPMSPREQYMLSWEAATERLLDAAALPEGAPRTTERPLHSLAYWAHWCMGVQPVFDLFRIATGAGPATRVSHADESLNLK